MACTTGQRQLGREKYLPELTKLLTILLRSPREHWKSPCFHPRDDDRNVYLRRPSIWSPAPGKGVEINSSFSPMTC